MFILEFETDSPILKATREAVPEMHLTYEEERMANHSNQIRLLFLASGGDFQRFEAAMEDDWTVEDYTGISEGEDERLYRITYGDEAAKTTPLELVIDLDATVLDAETITEGWRVRMRFPSRQALQAFKSWFDERDLPFNITKLYARNPAIESQHSVNLTKKQYEALRRAYEAGYFEIPRDKELNELASEQGISDTAYSRLLRRGLSGVLDQYLDTR